MEEPSFSVLDGTRWFFRISRIQTSRAPMWIFRRVPSLRYG